MTSQSFPSSGSSSADPKGSPRDGEARLSVVSVPGEGFAVMRNGVRTLLFAKESEANAYVRAVNAHGALSKDPTQ